MDADPLTTAGPGRPGAEHPLDAAVYAQLRARRQVFVRGALDDAAANRLAAELLSLDADGADPVTVHVTGSGGPLPALFAVTDTIHAMLAPVRTTCLGQAVGTAAALVAAGTGTRAAGASAQLVLHLPDVEVSGSSAAVTRAAEAHEALREQLVTLLARSTGKTRDHVAERWQHGAVLTGEQARDEGLVDEVVGHGAVGGG